MKNLLLIITYLLLVSNILMPQENHTHDENCTNDHSPETTEVHNHTNEADSHIHTQEEDAHDHSQEDGVHEHESQITNLETYILKPATFVNTVRTTGIIKVSPKSETILTAKSSGIINFLSNQLVEGSEISKGVNLFSISGKDMIEGNLEVQFINAKNAYLQSLENFERAKALIEDKIISQKEFEERKAQFEVDDANYHILKKNYSSKSLQIQSPITGQIYELFVQNGDFVEAGQKLAMISGNDNNILEVSLPKKYFANLEGINSGTFKMEYDKKLHPFMSEAKLSNANRITPGSPYIPLNFEISDKNLLPGSFAEVWLNVEKTPNSIVIPKSALMEQQGLYFVFHEISEGDFLKVQVEVEAINAYEAKISSGLHFGDEIVIDGVLELKLIQSTGVIDPHAGHNH